MGSLAVKEQLVEFFTSTFSLPVATIFLATLPILELRGALPVAILWKEPLPLWQAYALAVFGNMLPIPFIIFLLQPITDFVRRWKHGDAFVEWLFARTRRKGKNIEKYEFWGLTIFVAIPLPMTGAWTGAMAGHLFGLKWYKTLCACFCGVCIAGVIMSALAIFARGMFIRFFGLG
jgi:uncharacterized membrane protein